MEGDTPAWLGKNLFLWSVLDLLGCESSWVSGGCQDARGGAGCDSGHCSHLTATLRSCLGPPNYARAFPLLLGNSSGVPAQPAQPAQRVWGQAGLHSLQEGSCRARIPDFLSWHSLGVVPGLGCTLCLWLQTPDFYPGTVWERCQLWLCPGAEELRVQWRVWRDFLTSGLCRTPVGWALSPRAVLLAVVRGFGQSLFCAAAAGPAGPDGQERIKLTGQIKWVKV